MYGLLFWIFSRHFLSLNLTPINQGACLAGGCLRFNLSPLTDTEINLLAKLYTLWGVLIFFPPNYMYTPNSASIQSSRFVPFVFEIGVKTRFCYCISAKKRKFFQMEYEVTSREKYMTTKQEKEITRNVSQTFFLTILPALRGNFLRVLRIFLLETLDEKKGAWKRNLLSSKEKEHMSPRKNITIS